MLEVRVTYHRATATPQTRASLPPRKLLIGGMADNTAYERTRHDLNTFPPHGVLRAKPASELTRGWNPGYPLTPRPLAPCRLGPGGLCCHCCRTNRRSGMEHGFLGLAGGVEQRRRGVSATGSARVGGGGFFDMPPGAHVFIIHGGLYSFWLAGQPAGVRYLLSPGRPR